MLLLWQISSGYLCVERRAREDMMFAAMREMMEAAWINGASGRPESTRSEDK